MAGAGTPLGGARRADFGVQATDTVNSVSYKLMNKIFGNFQKRFDWLKLKRNKLKFLRIATFESSNSKKIIST